MCFWIFNACSGTAFQRFCFRVGYVLEVGLVSQLELVLFLQLLCSWRYKCELYVSMSRICDVTRGTDHVVRFTFWLSFRILQAIKNRSRGRPGNEASYTKLSRANLSMMKPATLKIKAWEQDYRATYFLNSIHLNHSQAPLSMYFRRQPFRLRRLLASLVLHYFAIISVSPRYFAMKNTLIR